MAIDINSVYQKVLALSNKEQRGYITPQEFNLFADRAQNDIYENYFQQLNIAQLKPKSNGTHNDPVEVIEMKLEPFLSTLAIGFLSADNEIKPGVADVTYASDTANQQNDLVIDLTINSRRIVSLVNPTTNNVVTKVSLKELNELNANKLTAPTLTRQVYTNYFNLGFRLHPPPEVDTLYNITFYKHPVQPKWAYIIVNGKALHDATSASNTNFNLHESEEENVVSRILMMAGVTIKQPDLQQSAVGSMQLNKQEQNS